MAWAFHWRAPLQTKGFLKIIEFVLAILVFSLVAGFTLGGQVKCPQVTNLPNTSYSVSYPYSNYHNGSSGGMSGPFGDSRASSGAQFMVTWGIFTTFYCVVALVVYVLFTANETMEKLVDILVYVDLGCHLAWVVGWFIVSVEWAVSAVSISHTFSAILKTAAAAEGQQCTWTEDTNVQANIAAVFSFLSLFVWAANVYWVLIDSAFFIKWQSQRRAANFENF